MTTLPGTPRPVGYVMTHYPKLAQTFISGEIDAVQHCGIAVTCFAMNRPEASERQACGAAEKIARTTYLKASPLRALAGLLRVSASHPIAMADVWRVALASSGGSIGRACRRIAHLAQAVVVADTIRATGITRLHAQFGLAPATIAWFATLITRARGGKCAFSFTIHGFHDFADPAETRLDLKAAAACRVLCVSDFTRSQLCLTTDPALWWRFVVARCGIDLSRFAYRDPPPSGGTLTVLALGRLSAEKGLAMLIEAVAALHTQGVDVRLRLVGDGPLRTALERQADALGIAAAVDFAGELPPEAVQAELHRADVFCMASFSEGLPVSIMEAMAVGVPVVTTWIAGIPELAVDGVTALTVPPANAAALAGAVRQMATEPDLRLRLARAARCAVEARHDQTQTGAQVAALLIEDRP